MIHHGDFQILAERLLEDKRSLEVIFRGRPTEQIEIRKVIKIVENEWFKKVKAAGSFDSTHLCSTWVL